MLYLKQSTAAQSVILGPYVDDTDGATAETGLTIANTDIRLSAAGGNMFAKTSGGGTHDEAGWYTITLDATDTATVGTLQISSKVAGALAVWMECQVLEEAIFDDLFGTGAALAKAAALATLDTTVGVAGVGLTDLGGMSDGMKAEVNVEALDVLDTDTFVEPTGVPAATITLREKIGWLFMVLRNKLTVTSSKKQFFDDAGNAEWEKDLADDATTYSESEGNTP